MEKLIFDYILSIIVPLLFIGTSFYTFKKKEISKYLSFLILIIGLVTFSLNFIKPSLIENINLIQKTKNIDLDKVESLIISYEDYTVIEKISKKEKMTQIINSLKNMKPYNDRLPGYRVNQYILIVNLKEAQDLIFKIHKTDNKEMFISFIDDTKGYDFEFSLYKVDDNLLNEFEL